MPETYKFRDKDNGQLYVFDWNKPEPPSDDEINSILDQQDAMRQQNMMPQKEPSFLSRFGSEVWKTANEPLIDLDTQAMGDVVAPVDEMNSIPSALAAGAVEGLGNVAEGFTSPLSILSMLASGGAAKSIADAGKLALATKSPMIAPTLLPRIATGIDATQAGVGGVKVAEGDMTGLLDIVLGGGGALAANPALRSIELDPFARAAAKAKQARLLQIEEAAKGLEEPILQDVDNIADFVNTVEEVPIGPYLNEIGQGNTKVPKLPKQPKPVADSKLPLFVDEEPLPPPPNRAELERLDFETALREAVAKSKRQPINELADVEPPAPKPLEEIADPLGYLERTGPQPPEKDFGPDGRPSAVITPEDFNVPEGPRPALQPVESIGSKQIDPEKVKVQKARFAGRKDLERAEAEPPFKVVDKRNTLEDVQPIDQPVVPKPIKTDVEPIRTTVDDAVRYKATVEAADPKLTEFRNVGKETVDPVQPVKTEPVTEAPKGMVQKTIKIGDKDVVINSPAKPLDENVLGEIIAARRKKISKGAKPDTAVSMKGVYEDYVAWSKANNHTPSLNEFKSILAKSPRFGFKTVAHDSLNAHAAGEAGIRGDKAVASDVFDLGPGQTADKGPVITYLRNLQKTAKELEQRRSDLKSGKIKPDKSNPEKGSAIVPGQETIGKAAGKVADVLEAGKKAIKNLKPDPTGRFSRAIKPVISVVDKIDKKYNTQIGAKARAYIKDWEEPADHAIYKHRNATQDLTDTQYDDFVRVMDTASGYTSKDSAVMKAAAEVRAAINEVKQAAKDAGILIGEKDVYFPHKKGADFDHDKRIKVYDTDELPSSNLEFSRQDNRSIFDKPGYRRDRGVLDEYFNDSYRRISEANNFGKALENILPDKNGMQIDPELADYVGDAVRRLTGRKKTKLTDRILAEGRHATALAALKMSAINQAGQFAHIYSANGQLGGGRVLRAIDDLYRKGTFKKSELEAIRSGSLRPSILGELFESSGHAGKVADLPSKIGEKLHLPKRLTDKGKGFLWGIPTADKHMRLVADKVGRLLVDDARKGDAGAIKTLKSLGFDPPSSKLTGKADLEKYYDSVAKKFTNDTNFRTGILDQPLWTTSTYGRVATQFTSFMYQHTRFIGNLIKKSKTDSEARKQLALFAASAILVGEGVNDVKAYFKGNGIEGKNPKDMADDMIRVLGNKRHSHPLWRSIQNIAAAGGAGIFQSLIEGLLRDKKQLLVGPLGSKVAEGLEAVTETGSRIYRDKPKKLEPVGKFGLAQATTYDIANKVYPKKRAAISF